MTPRDNAYSTNFNFIHKIYGNLNCDTSNVVYLLKCGACDKQYVGKTETAFCIRFNNYRAHTKSLPKLPLSKHINIPRHSFDKLEVTFPQSGFKTNQDREQRVLYLIYKFNTIKAGITEHPGILTSMHAMNTS